MLHFLWAPDLLLSVDCTVLETAAILHSETKGLPNFPITSCAAPFKCKHTLPTAVIELQFGFSMNLKLVSLMFEGCVLFDFAKTIGFMA